MFKLWTGRPWRAIPVAAVAVLAGVVAVPATASAATLFVSTAAPSAPYSSCSHPGYTSIQDALNAAAPDSTIVVCGGTYTEQLEITKEVTLIGKSNPVVKLPATPHNSSTICDDNINAATGGIDQDLVSICMPKTAVVTGMTFEANWPGVCSDSLYGIMVAGGATLNATKVKVDGAGALIGCQGGVGIEVGFGYNIDEKGYTNLTKVTVENYNKNGITIDGAGSEAAVTKTTITGAGSAPTGQNGIQVSRGATATISHSTISDNECDIVSVCGDETASQWEEDGAGVLVYRGAAQVEQLKLANNNIGVEYVSEKAASGEVPTGQLTLESSKVTGGYASVELGQGNARLKGNKLTGGAYGIVASLNQYATYEGTGTYAPTATASDEKIEGSQAAIKVEPSFAPLAGSLAITSSRIKGSIVNEDPQFTIG